MEKAVPSYKRKWITVPAPRKADPRTYTYEELYEEYWPALHKLYYYSVRDFHEAEHLAQEAMFKVWRYWDRLQWDKLGGAIGRIANNVRYDYLRGNFEKPDKEFYDDVLEFESHDEGVTDPLRKLIIERAADCVEEFSDGLKDKYREIFLDFYTRDMDIAEICEKHKMQRGNIYTHLHRIRTMLGESFGMYDLIPDGYWNRGQPGVCDGY
ncbi:MAG: RNA polymerase sigma factor [Fusobacteriaceae bacterium]